MDNLRAVIKNLFCYICPEEILQEKTTYNHVTEETFLNLGSGYLMNYSYDELHNMYYFLENEFTWNKCKLQGKLPNIKIKQDFNVFDALNIFNSQVLIEEDNEPKCQYIHLLRWRDMITALEEDLFVVSFLAYRDAFSARERKDFFWKPVIGHNNHELNALAARGVAENHFHLKGSAPYFHLSWISMMNDVDNYKFQQIFDLYDSNRLQKNIAYSAQYREYKMGHLWRQAALIRTFLFCIIQDTYLQLSNYKLSLRELLCLVSKEENEKIISNKETLFHEGQRVTLKDVQMYLSAPSILKVKQHCSYKFVKFHLENEKDMEDVTGIIQLNIERLREEYGNRNLDYLICRYYLEENTEGHVNELLSGERWFLYTMFREVFNNQEIKNKFYPYINWFYLYLVIKANIRRELIQTNNNVGFSNFDFYQKRKENFIDDTKFETPYLKMAVRDTLQNQHICKMELRIAPKESAEKLFNAIRKYDNAVLMGIKDDKNKQKLLDKYFYVIHFIKESEHWNVQDKYKEQYRHYEVRMKVRRQALAIAQLRDGGSNEAARIRGIDAASPEIWCRPEVFAQAFRYLRNQTVKEKTKKYSESICPQLMATYHVGEDFLDIIDGLRAIDEAVLFLNLRCGDRLGHALALGVDVDEWYSGKSNRIMINKMGYLDNLVWLYAKIRKYNLSDCVAATSYIEKRFDEYFQEIYSENFAKNEISSIAERAKEYYGEAQMADSYDRLNMSFNINVYYDAWKLRGDNPEYYREGFFKVPEYPADEWEKYAINKEFPTNYKIRYNPETALLYYLYNFNSRVKCVGDQMVEVKINVVIKEAIKKVVRKMQREISDLGVAIEVNPSSNYLIGTFRRYDKHPITKWYNLGLTNNASELEKCPQIPVSINTDDQGVFATYIENEYAYLALALEKKMNDEGQRIYNRTMIMQWLDNIRKMGIDQSFMGDDRENIYSKSL